MLTHKQRQFLDFIAGFISENGYGPSYEEMMDALGLSAKSGAHRMVYALKERGFITNLKHKDRSIRILKMPPSIPKKIWTHGLPAKKSGKTVAWVFVDDHSDRSKSGRLKAKSVSYRETPHD